MFKFFRLSILYFSRILRRLRRGAACSIYLVLLWLLMSRTRIQSLPADILVRKVKVYRSWRLNCSIWSQMTGWMTTFALRYRNRNKNRNRNWNRNRNGFKVTYFSQQQQKQIQNKVFPTTATETDSKQSISHHSNSKRFKTTYFPQQQITKRALRFTVVPIANTNDNENANLKRWSSRR